MCIVSLAIASTVLTLNTYKKGDDGEPVPEILQKIFFQVVAKLLCIKVRINSDVNLSVKKAFAINHKYAAYVKKLSQRNKINKINDKIDNKTLSLKTKIASLQKLSLDKANNYFYKSNDSDYENGNYLNFVGVHE